MSATETTDTALGAVPMPCWLDYLAEPEEEDA